MAYFYPGSTYDRQSRIAQSSQNFDQVSGTPLSLQGQDALPPGQVTFDTRRPYAPFIPRRVIDLSTYVDGSEFWLFGTDRMAPGQQRMELPPRAALRAPDYTFVDASEVWLFGTDAMATGRQSFDLAPRAAPRAATLSDPGYNLTVWLNLATQAVQGPGQATTLTALPPAGAARARDYTYVDPSENWLFGTDAMATGQQSFALASSPSPLRLRDYSITEAFPLTLIGRDAMLAGAQSTALPPVGPQRARDYTFAPPVNLPTLTTVVQQIPYGAQLTDSLPPRAAPRLRDYTWSQDLIPDLIGQDQLNAGQQSFALAPSPAPFRARDYSITAAFPLELISQDALNVGHQFFDLPPIAPLRSRDYSFTPPVNLVCLTTVQQPIPPGQQSTDSLPPKPAARARDYTHLDQTRRQLIGQDAFPTGQNADRSALPPKAAQRSRDYTWLQPYKLFVFEQLPTGYSTNITEGPPKGPLRLRDYTHLDVTKQTLAGQDAMVTGQSWLRTDNLPPKAYPRLVDYTWYARFDLADFISHTKPGHHSLSDRAMFEHTLYDRSLYAHTVSDQEMSQ